MAINRFKKGIENIKQTDSEHLQNISSNTQDTHVANDTKHTQDTHVANDTKHTQDTHVANDTKHTQDTHVANNTKHTQDTHVANDTKHTQDTHVANNTKHTHVSNIECHTDEIQKNQIVLDTIQSAESNHTKNRGKREERYGLLLDKKLKEDLKKLVSAECGRSMNDFIVNILISYVEAPKNQEILQAYDELLKFKTK